MGEHTPGPWHSESGTTVRAENGEPIFELWQMIAGSEASKKRRQANLRLGAAAPELVNALTDMLAGWRYIRENHGDLYGVGWDRAEQAARAALAKASGLPHDERDGRP